MTAEFRPGLDLSEDFYRQIVAPVLEELSVRHSAGLFGPGSEVLGYDSARSTDHDWGPRVQIFLPDDHEPDQAATIAQAVNERLPDSFAGFPTRFEGSRPPGARDGHHVSIAGLGDWFAWALQFDPRGPISVQDWLSTPSQKLAEVTRGRIFHDGLDQLEQAQSTLAWYPDDVWRYLLACQWQRIGQEEPFPGRCAEVGDELGSAVVAARLVRDLIRLILLMERRYPPYSKWIGTEFARSTGGQELTPLLTQVLAATSWRDREPPLLVAYTKAAELQNDLGLTDPVDTSTRPFFTRPYSVLSAERIAAALAETIKDDQLRGLPRIGGIDQYVDNTDALGKGSLRSACCSAVLDLG